MEIMGLQGVHQPLHFISIEEINVPRIAYGTEEYFRQQYPSMPDERVYALLAEDATNPDVHTKELTNLLIKNVAHYQKTIRLRVHTPAFLCDKCISSSITPPLPQTTHAMLIAGAPGSGKTSMKVLLLQEKASLSQMF